MHPPFSSRTAWDLTESAFAAALRERRAAGGEILDLAVSNPTACGFSYAAALLAPLSSPAVLRYQPEAFGLPAARRAVAGYYTAHGAPVSPDDILLTASTSESYSYLFRLLCVPGENILVPRPGYPLFDYLAALDNIELRSYDMLPAGGWAIDFAALRAAITPQTCAIIVVSPNNPTGHNTSSAEREQLLALCKEHSLTLIVDEVFLDYQLAPAAGISTFAALEPSVPIFVLSGISKIAALPQMKLGWIVVHAPEILRAQALARLEVIADTYLSVNTPAQHALPQWLAARAGIQSQILARIRTNLATLADAKSANPLLDYLPPQAGWNVLLRLPATQTSESLAITLLRRHGVLLHPGSLYGLPESGWLVASTITPAEVFAHGIAHLSSLLGEESRK